MEYPSNEGDQQSPDCENASPANCQSCGAGGCDSRMAPEAEPDDDTQILRQRLALIKHKIVVLSGKGGVGKSTVAVNLAMALSLAGKRVGLMDVDIHGPSVPTMLGLNGSAVVTEMGQLVPVELGELKVMSIGFLLRHQDDAVIWRGPMKMGVIQQFLKDVNWGELDYLIIDSPPGTGDEPLSVCQLIEDLDGAVIVTTPQKVATNDVRKSINFCHQLELPILGVIENMSGFICPHCNENVDVFQSGGGKSMAESMQVPFLGAIPIDLNIVQASDEGLPYLHRFSDTPTAQLFEKVIEPILAMSDTCSEEACSSCAGCQPAAAGADQVKIAIPMAEGKLALHFGHCQQFALITADRKQQRIVHTEFEKPPEHEPGVLPRWLNEHKVNVVLAGGMGNRAQQLFADQGIQVITGAPSEDPITLVEAFLADKLVLGSNTCDH